MGFDWRKYLELARFLLNYAGGDVDREAGLRSAASRAYFAAFSHARNYAVAKLGFVAKDSPDDHGALKAHLKKGKTAKLADRLDRLRQWRNTCDYAEDAPVGLDTVVEAAVAEAEKVFAGLSLPPTAP
jgi:hypothetical protein